MTQRTKVFLLALVVAAAGIVAAVTGGAETLCGPGQESRTTNAGHTEIDCR